MTDEIRKANEASEAELRRLMAASIHREPCASCQHKFDSGMSLNSESPCEICGKTMKQRWESQLQFELDSAA